MPTTIDIVQQIKSRDWHGANENFATLMQQKVSQRLAQEQKSVANQDKK
jgi:hypothetical protein